MFVVRFKPSVFYSETDDHFRQLPEWPFGDLVAENSGVQCFGLRGFTPLQRTGQAFGLGNPWSCLDGKLLGHLTWDVDPVLR